MSSKRLMAVHDVYRALVQGRRNRKGGGGGNGAIPLPTPPILACIEGKYLLLKGLELKNHPLDF